MAISWSKTLAVNLVCALVTMGSVCAFAQDRESIIAKAKEEKTLVYYSTTDIRDGTAVVHAFQKKYPFIEPKLFRSGQHAGGHQSAARASRRRASLRCHIGDQLSSFMKFSRKICFRNTTPGAARVPGRL